MESLFSDLSDEDLAIKAEVEEFLLNEVAPHVNDIDQGKKEIWDVIRPMGEKGLLGIPFPMKYGGRSGSFKQDLLMSEAVCYYSLAIDMSRAASVYPAFMIRRFGKQKCFESILILL